MNTLRSLVLAVLLALVTNAATAAADTPAAKPYLTLEALRAKYADRRNGRFVTIGGVEIYHKDEGKGPVILLVHGSQSTLRTWDFIAPVLVQRGYRVIRYDTPPLGLSGSPPRSTPVPIHLGF